MATTERAIQTSGLVDNVSEINQRGLYRQWADLMAGKNWAELKPDASRP